MSLTGFALNNEQAGALEGRFCSSESMGCPRIPVEGCSWLVCIIAQAGRELKPSTPRLAGTVPGSSDKGLFGWRLLSMGAQWEGELEVMSLEAFQVSDVKTALDINFGPYARLFLTYTFPELYAPHNNVMQLYCVQILHSN